LSTSLTTLLTRTRDHLDESSADRFSDAELTRYINQGMRQVQSQIQAANEDYFIRVETPTAASGSYQLAFPADIWGNKLRGVWFYQGASAVGTAYRAAPASLESIYSNLVSSGYPEKYCFHAGFIRWSPMLSVDGTFRFIYAMKENELVAGVDVLGQIADEHTDCISLYAAFMARAKISADAKTYYELYTKRMQQIMNDVQPTDPFCIPQIAID